MLPRNSRATAGKKISAIAPTTASEFRGIAVGMGTISPPLTSLFFFEVSAQYTEK